MCILHLYAYHHSDQPNDQASIVSVCSPSFGPTERSKASIVSVGFSAEISLALWPIKAPLLRRGGVLPVYIRSFGSLINLLELVRLSQSLLFPYKELNDKKRN